MGWFTRVVAIITCRGNAAVDEKALEKRNKLRKRLGKNQIVPQAQTDLDITTERIQSSPKERPTSFDIFTVEKQKDGVDVGDTEQTAEVKEEQVVGGDVNTGDVEKAGGDAEMYEFARNYIKTLVIPGAVERFMAEKDREQHNVSVASTGGSSDISVAVSDLVRASLTNAQELLKEELMINKGRDHTEAVRYDRSGATEVSRINGGKYVLQKHAFFISQG